MPAESDELLKAVQAVQAAIHDGRISREVLDAALGPSAAARAVRSSLGSAVPGSGALAAAPHSVAAGEHGIAIGRIGKVYVGPPPKNGIEALKLYRELVVSRLADLPLRGLDAGAVDPQNRKPRISLAAVYVDLHTLTGQPAWDAVISTKRLVVLGDPGSGKSTFFNYLAFALAASALNIPLNPAPALYRTDVVLSPIVVILRDFARSLTPDDTPTPQLLWNFICAGLREQNITEAEVPLRLGLEEGRVVTFLDGLDEVADSKTRQVVRDTVQAFIERYPRARFVVTCRILSYQEPSSRLEEVPQITLAPFSDEQVQDFVQHWYDELCRSGLVKVAQAQALGRKLVEAIRRTDLVSFAQNPLLLTVMAMIHTHKGALPDARALLYEETIDLLLWRWEQTKMTEGDAGIRQLLSQQKRTAVDLKRVLWRLAYEAHTAAAATGGKTQSGINELALEKALAELHEDGSHDWAQQIIEIMKVRAGLLLERVPEVFSFPHRTFQEYLAGAYLATRTDFGQVCRELAREDSVYWREVILHAVGRFVHINGDVAHPLDAAAECGPDGPPSSDAEWRRVALTADVLAEVGAARVTDTVIGRTLIKGVREGLRELIRQSQLTVTERVAGARTLGRIGDPRFRLRADSLVDDDQLGFVFVPAHLATIGVSDEEAAPLRELGYRFRDWEGRYREERPRDENGSVLKIEGRRVEVGGFWIGSLRVTVGQLIAFLQSQDPRIAELWHEVPDDQKPTIVDLTQQTLNEPAVVHKAVAEAYALCLGRRVSGASDVPRVIGEVLAAGWTFRLPHEDEWESACRGGDTRIFPWGNGSLNVSTPWGLAPPASSGFAWAPSPPSAPESIYGSVLLPVGSVMENASPFNLFDMCDAYPEWCISSRQEAVLRGGRCSCREPARSTDRAAFRLVLAPQEVGADRGR